MNRFLVAAWQANQLWYAAPLIVVVSLVYAATRHEQMGAILVHALRLGTMIVGFMAAVLLVLIAVSRFGGVVPAILVVLALGWWAARAWRSRSHASSPPRKP
jgi:uncharacterized membrane protein